TRSLGLSLSESITFEMPSTLWIRDLSKTSTPTTAIPLNVAFDTNLTGADTGGATGATLNLIASYYKTNATAAKVGLLQSNVIYTVSYL
ncbi:hypothetical protein AB7W20_09150, partial [Providencia rettgeri]